ncbi:MAG TPA: energy transducer TonB [Nevskiaceae bacterium]|nr:energy transducer TonB [Nevskiaceae bacterium]
MADRRYAVTFGGELIEGMTTARLRERLSKLPEPISAAQIDALLAARNATVKLFADRESADRFVGLLREAGIVCWLRLLHPGEQVHALLDDVAVANPEPVAIAAPPAIAPVAPRAALGPGAMTALIVLGVSGSIGAWYAWPQPARRHHAVSSSEDSAPAPTPEPIAETPASVPIEAPPATASKASTALIVPEPPLVISVKHDKPKPETPAPAETAKLEAPKAEPIKVEPVKPAPAPTQVAMIKARAPTADVIVPPSYDRSRVAQPKYPSQAYRNGDQGEVLLMVLVGSDGKAKKVSVDRTSGSTLLDRAALDAVKRWQFSPGTRNGVPQEAARQVAIGFKLGDQ